MSVYSLDALIEETRRLAAEFRRTTGTMLPVSAEIARYDVCHHLGLIPAETRGCGYDATGSGRLAGVKIQIKSRVIGEQLKSGHRIGQLNMEAHWDLVMLSLMDNEFEPLEIYALSREDITQALKNNHKRSRRGAISIARCRIIGELLWTREQGRERTAQAVTEVTVSGGSDSRC